MWGNVVGINKESYRICHVCDSTKNAKLFTSTYNDVCVECLDNDVEISSRWGCDKCRKVYRFDIPGPKPVYCDVCGCDRFVRVSLG